MRTMQIISLLPSDTEIVAGILHPHIFSAANHGTCWMRHA
jgi:hypothetical protein